MIGMADVTTLILELEMLISEAQRMQINLVLNEDRVCQARAGLAGLDDESARRAVASAGRAHDDLCNANYGSLDSFLKRTESFITRLRLS